MNYKLPCVCFVVPLLFWFTTPALATFSIIVYDQKSGLFGAASASCHPSFEKNVDVGKLLTVIVPEKGIVTIQGYVGDDNPLKKDTEQLLRESNYKDAMDLIDKLRRVESSAGNHNNYQNVQYLVIVKKHDGTLSGAAHTGKKLKKLTPDNNHAPEADEVYFQDLVVAGNRLTPFKEKTIMAQMYNTYYASEGSLEDKLINAISSVNELARIFHKQAATTIPSS
ncbi:hypothetical protein GZ77_25930 [Endozoicomonas montiporae]|uniref:Uncharacterized protein n=1 Tax=Endozoicomonas montiporae TaxID=1027273 RepID=A0A081MYQ3_9GAMM|nr:DUF1028 domain-containing protein [Endozoicomonas montiporae]KEQ11326.1 hypothetical protein GZ77_25930 [Endozoicomonas montiporae]